MRSHPKNGVRLGFKRHGNPVWRCCLRVVRTGFFHTLIANFRLNPDLGHHRNSTLRTLIKRY
jgi:hypothetical protein